MVLKSKLMKIDSVYKQENHQIGICLSMCENIVGAKYNNTNFLNCNEIKYLQSDISDFRRSSYICGRYAAKMSVNLVRRDLSFEEIYIENGIFNQPILKNEELDVTISHTKNYGIALAFSRKFICGVDIQEIDNKNSDFLVKILDINEITMLADIEKDLHKRLLILWVVKEALSKCLKTGINIDLDILSVQYIKEKDSYFEGEFCNFSQYRFIVFRYENFYISIVFPKYIDFRFDVNKFVKLPFCKTVNYTYF